MAVAFSLALGTFVLAVSANTATGAAAPPATDSRGFVDSTARCAPPSNAVAYGYTSSSRVAICKDDSSGQYQYRGVRVGDGARLILAAKSTDRGYVAENDGIIYIVTAAALVVSDGSHQIRSETMLDFHGSAPGPSTPSAPSTSSTSTQSSAVPETTTPATPLPPPLPAEVGGG